MGDKKKVSITGGMGFIGVHLANALVSRGYKVTVMDNLSHPSYLPLDDRVEVRWGDVRNVSDCEKLAYESDIIFHLAAEINIDKSIEDPQMVLDVNINGTKNILEAARKSNNIVLIASSSEVYGDATTYLQKETHPLNGKSPYAASKIAADRLAYAYHKTYGLDVRIVRAFNVCGEGQGFDSYGAVIAKFIKLIQNDEPVNIFGTGKQTRDYTYISDTIEGYLTILEKGKAGEVYNIATGKDWSVITLVDMLEKITGRLVKRNFVEARSGEVMKLKGDSSKLQELGWEPKVTFAKALEKIWTQSTL